MTNLKKRMAEANAVIDTVSIQDVIDKWANPDTVFVDVRETVEREKLGSIPGATHAPRGFLEFIADPDGPMHKEEFASGKDLILYCATGGRSALAAKTLHEMGIRNVTHLAGGFTAWCEAKGAVEMPERQV